MAVHAVESAVWMAVTTVVTVVLIPFQTVVMLVWIAVITVETVVLIAFQTVETVV